MADVKKINGYDINDDTSRKNIGCTADTYNSSETYEIDDVVVYNKAIYKCITAITVPEDFDSSKWEQICLRDLIIETRKNMGNALKIYSSEEKVIGEWYGKPLYGKTITCNMPKTKNSAGVYAEYVQTGLSNCKIRNFYGMCHQENGEQSFPFPITNNDNIKNQVQALFPNCSQLTLTSYFNWDGYVADITLEYTKNTD